MLIGRPNLDPLVAQKLIHAAVDRKAAKRAELVGAFHVSIGDTNDLE
jgi:hypothetical protein